MRSVYWQSLLGLCLLACAGCATQQPVLLTGDPIVDSQKALEMGPRRDRVLWEYRGAAAYMRKGQFSEAKRLLDDALLTMGGNLTADPNSRKARSYFHDEAKKSFIGEPYERVMAYYYRGILYWMDGEPDNARACFRSGQLEDGDAQDKSYAADYVLLDYLDGFATAKLGGDGSDAYQRARKLDKSNSLPPYDTKANVLFFLEFGHGPEKYAGGEYGQELHFRSGHSTVRRAVITIDNQTTTAPAYDDLTYQATTRGGRVMDHILGNKAVFKDATGAVGVGAMAGGAIMMMNGNRDTQAAGAGLLAFGVLSEIVSAATTPSADTRTWDNLPQNLSFAAVRVPPGEHEAKVQFQDAYGMVLPGLTKTVKLSIPPGARDSVVFLSDQYASY